MIVFKAIRSSPDQPNKNSTVEAGRIWLQDGHLHASGTESVVSIARCPLETVFDGDIDPATEPERFLDQLPVVYHGSRFWAEEAPDDTPPPEPNIPVES